MSHTAHTGTTPVSPEEHEKQIHDLRSVLEVSRELSATNDLTPLLQKVEHAALKVLECERATVFLYDREQNELYSRMATGVDEIRFSADLGIAGEVVRTGEIINVPDAYADPRFNPEIDQKTGFRTRNMVTFPLIGFDRSIVGVLQVLNKHSGDFDPWDHELVKTFGAQVGVAVQRQLLLEHYAEKQRIERDLNIARKIQKGLLPQEDANVEGFDIAGWNKPADETGGDCYDFLALPDGSLAVTIADATGHGIGPALMIAECRALFRATTSLSQDLSEVTTRVNNLLCEDLPDDRFVTAFFGLLLPKAETLAYLSAGHGPLIKYTRADDRIEERRANGPPLGIMPDMSWSNPEAFKMAPGDMMILVTDGFFEWQNAEQEQFGTERIFEIIRKHRDRPCTEIIKHLHEAVVAFAGDRPQDDDLTAVIIKKL
ncbi:MAG: SpoIIE family protein phosphatase [Phycisphaerales bacterium]|nr:SpoIIE family protein phosphatase [Phycisphaerales bacterium]